MVTVRVRKYTEPRGFAQGIGPMRDWKDTEKHVPMCELCAAFHEAKERAR